MDRKKDESEGKPFYENIVLKRNRASKPAKGRDDKGSHAEKGARDEKGSREGGAPRGHASPRPVLDRSSGGARRDAGAQHNPGPRRIGKAPRTQGARHDERTQRAASAAQGERKARGEKDAHDAVHGTTPRGSAPRAAAPRRENSPAGGIARREGRPRTDRKPFSPLREFDPVFKQVSPETRALLDAFPEIAQAVLPLDSKKIQQLPSDIRELSHELTDERGERRVGYMNEPAVLSAYVRYYMWWNLVRLTRVFSALPLDLADGSAAVDLGSGPLTLPIALWMARPDLRDRKITWYCVDISQGALAAGEEIFLSLAARTGNEPWQIVRVKGECGVSLRRQVSLVASANMFNELFWDNPQPLEAQAKHHASDLASYAERDASVLIIEPGVPRAGRFISLMRDALIRLGFSIQAPCPHEGVCPFPGLRYGKWCHFVFDTADAPAKLQKLSEDANLVKDRAALSFVFAQRRKADEEPVSDSAEPISSGVPETEGAVSTKAASSAEAPVSMLSRMSGLFPDLRVRITSDPIKLPDYYTGRYGCSEVGMVLLTGTYQAADYLKECHSGSLVEVPMPDRKKAERDPKTDAIVIRLK